LLLDSIDYERPAAYPLLPSPPPYAGVDSVAHFLVRRAFLSLQVPFLCALFFISLFPVWSKRMPCFLFSVRINVLESRPLALAFLRTFFFCLRRRRADAASFFPFPQLLHLVGTTFFFFAA